MENDIYKLGHGYILLEDLKSWHSHGFISSDDKVRIWSKGGKGMGWFKVGFIINSYGRHQKVPIKVGGASDKAPSVPTVISDTVVKEEETSESSLDGAAPTVPQPVPIDRIPLLHLPAKNAEMCRQKEFVNFMKFLGAMLTDRMKEEAMKTMGDWKCDYCSLSRMNFFDHIICQKHKKKMKFTAPLEDLEYWRKWVNARNQRSASEVSTSSKSRKKVPKNRSANNPRVPMLDQMMPNHKPVSIKKFNKILNEYSKIYLQDKNRLDGAAKLIVPSWICTYCGTPSKKVVLTNILDTFLHIKREKHRQKMKFQASLADLEHWKKWAESYGLPDTVLPPTIVFSKNTEKSDEKPKIERKKKTKKLEKITANTPRIPLLDLPENQSCLMSESTYLTRFDKICEQLKSLKSSKEIFQKISCKCYHCPGEQIMLTLSEVIIHVFYGTHAANIGYRANSADFDYYEGFLGKVTPLATAAPTVPTATVALNVKTTPQALVDCTLPLFVTEDKMPHRPDEVCIGPRNSEIIFLQRLVDNPDEWPTSFIGEKTKCGICNVNMSYWSIKKTVEHAFSVEHLYALKNTGTHFYTADFQWWMINLIADNTVLYPKMYIGSTLSVATHLGVLDNWHCRSSEAFLYFPTRELELLNNLDEKKLQSEWVVPLLNTFGCCVYCNKWLVTGMDAIIHHTSFGHFSMVRVKHTVKRADVNRIMHYVKNAQKEVTSNQQESLTDNPSNCILM